MGNTSQKKQGGLHPLLIWIIILGITLISILLPTTTYAASTTQGGRTAPLTRHNKQDCPALQYVCDTANQYAGGTAPSGGWIKAPIGANGNTLVFFTDPTLTVSQPTIQGLWNVGVLIVDAFIILLFIVSGIRMMMSGSVFRYADIAETAPRMLLALIAAHISLALMGILLGLNNDFSAALYTYATAHPSQGVNLDTTLGTDPGISLWNFRDSVWIPLIKLLIYIIRLALGLMLFAQLIVRVFLVDVYIVLGAPCIACWALPGRSGQPVTRMWLQGFISLVMVQAAQTAGIIVAELIVGNLVALVNQYLKVPSVTGGALTANDFVTAFMSIVVTWFVLRIPGMLQASPLQTLTAGGQMAVGIFGVAAGGAASLTETASMLAR